MGTVSEDEGQASVEFALILPLIAALALALVQAAVVVKDQVMVIHAAREAAREAAVDPGDHAARNGAISASPSLDAHRLVVRTHGRNGPGSRVKVELIYDSPTDVPLVGPLLGDVRVRANATMRVER